MSELIINGGRELHGQVRVHGAKNSVLPILAASLLCRDRCIIHDCPDLKDVRAAFQILEELGCSTEYEAGTAVVDSTNCCGCQIPEHLMREMRSSVMFLGAIVSVMGRAKVCYPGGCELGARPIDLHLKALSQLGVKVDEDGGYIHCSVPEQLKPDFFALIFPSVGATENIMLLMAVSDGVTTIFNAAREPEIVDLQNFLNRMGADIRGAGSDTIRIHGVKNLHGCEWRVVPDRIVASTYACAAAACGGDVTLSNVVPEHLTLVLSVLQDMGCAVEQGEDTLQVVMNRRPRGVGLIRTLPYPGFPTDVQAQMMAAAVQADGMTIFSETIFDSRFKHVDELVRMGADITVDGRTAVISGGGGLSGTRVVAADLRGGAALVIAGLCAQGKTTVGGVDLIDRGYESIERDFRLLGADIERR